MHIANNSTNVSRGRDVVSIVLSQIGPWKCGYGLTNALTSLATVLVAFTEECWLEHKVFVDMFLQKLASAGSECQ